MRNDPPIRNELCGKVGDGWEREAAYQWRWKPATYPDEDRYAMEDDKIITLRRASSPIR
jgi:hypothetical protein